MTVTIPLTFLSVESRVSRNSGKPWARINLLDEDNVPVQFFSTGSFAEEISSSPQLFAYPVGSVVAVTLDIFRGADGYSIRVKNLREGGET